MKISYEFADGTVSKIEVPDDVGDYITASRRSEASAERNHRRHCWSIDALLYLGSDYGCEDQYGLWDDTEEDYMKTRLAFSKLTEIQKRRLWLYANNHTLREIAEMEGASFQSVAESINAARKVFKKVFRETP